MQGARRAPQREPPPFGAAERLFIRVFQGLTLWLLTADPSGLGSSRVTRAARSRPTGRGDDGSISSPARTLQEPESAPPVLEDCARFDRMAQNFLVRVAHGCTRLHSVAQFCRAVGELLLGLRVKGWGRATHNLCEKARFSVTSVTALLAKELRVRLDFVRRSNSRNIPLYGCHLRVVTLRFPDD